MERTPEMRLMQPALAFAIPATLTQLDVTATAVALPAIRSELGFGMAGAAWVMDAYSLSFAAVLLASGALADRHGRRRALLVGNGVFAAASVLCGLAWDGPSLWLARALQGVAAALVITGGLASLSLAYANPAERTRAFGLVGVVTGAAMALGPTIGGLLAAGPGWRWIFLLNLPACAATAWIVPRLIAESRDPDGRSLDWTGTALLTAALALPALALLQSGGLPAWRWGGVAAGVALATGFVVQQRQREHPMLDPSLFTRARPIGIACVLLALSVGYWAVLVYLPQYLAAAFEMPFERIGLAMLAATLPMLALPPVGARLLRRSGQRTGFAMGMAVLAAGTTGLAVAAHPSSQAPLWAAVLAVAVAGSGAGLINAQASAALIAMAPPAQAGMTSAIATTLRQIGFVIGIAALGSAAQSPAAFAAAFTVAAVAAGLGALAAALLLRDPSPSPA